MKILRYPDPRLTAKNEIVDVFTSDLADKVREMFRLMENVGGVGLAAPQVGWNVRLFVLALGEEKDGVVIMKPKAFFNPKIEIEGELEIQPEGCLSFPGILSKIARYPRARLIAQTADGPVELALVGLAAQAAQHEMDHLDGVLFIDRMSPEELARIEPLLEELKKNR